MITFDRTAYDGFIFDCDGTLADSMPVHYRAWLTVLERHLGRPPVEVTWTLFQTYGGVAGHALVQEWNRDFHYRLPVEETVQAKARAFLLLLHEVQPIPDVLALLKELAPGARIAVASGGLTRVVAAILAQLGLTVGPRGEVQALVGHDQVAAGKPQPDLFLRAAELIGVPPHRCLVFEDAEAGFAAARAAGMHYVDVRSRAPSPTGRAP
jgi:beta-phosphoglucomutase-like phosphatase (HAD superfamily)